MSTKTSVFCQAMREKNQVNNYNLNTKTSREEQCSNSTRPVFETFHKTGIGTLLVDEDGKYE